MNRKRSFQTIFNVVARSVLAGVFVLPALLPAVAEAQPVDQTAGGVRGVNEALVFRRARAAYDAGNTEEALRDFQLAWTVQHSPNASLYIARCHRRQAQYVEAYNAYVQSSRDAAARADAEPQYAATRDTARSEANALQANVAFVVFAVTNAPDRARITLNGERTESAQWNERIAHAPGRVTIEASAEGMQNIRVEVQLSLGQETRVQIPFVSSSVNGAVQIQEGGVGFVDNGAVTINNPTNTPGPTNPNGNLGLQGSGPTPPNPPNPPPPNVDYPRSGLVPTGAVFLAVGGAALITGIVFEVLAANRWEELRPMCLQAGIDCANDPDYVRRVEQGRFWNGIGVAGIAAGPSLALIGGLMMAYGAVVNESNRMLYRSVQVGGVAFNLPHVHSSSQATSLVISGTF